MMPMMKDAPKGFGHQNPIRGGGTPAPENAPPEAPAEEDDEKTLLAEAAKNLKYLGAGNASIASLVARIEGYLAKDAAEEPAEGGMPMPPVAPMPMMG